MNDQKEYLARDYFPVRRIKVWWDGRPFDRFAMARKLEAARETPYIRLDAKHNAIEGGEWVRAAVELGWDNIAVDNPDGIRSDQMLCLEQEEKLSRERAKADELRYFEELRIERAVAIAAAAAAREERVRRRAEREKRPKMQKKEGYTPSGPGRNLAIFSEYKLGASTYASLGKKYGLSVSCISQVIRKLESKERQRAERAEALAASRARREASYARLDDILDEGEGFPRGELQVWTPEMQARELGIIQ